MLNDVEVRSARYRVETHAEIPTQNAKICELMAQSMMRGLFECGLPRTRIITSVQSAEDRIFQMAQSSVIRPEKALEWLAAMSAIRAFLAKHGTEYTDALERTKKYLQYLYRMFNADRHRGMPDLVQNDPIYRLAVTTRGPHGGQFEMFVEEIAG